MSPEERKEAGIIDLPSTLVTLLKHWKQMKWFVKLWVIISIQTSLMRNVWNGQAMLPLFQ